MSTNSKVVGITFCGFTRPSNIFNLESGTEITPTLGSIVQNGKLAASALLLEIALNKVDFPTLGRPTIPHFSPMNYFLRRKDNWFDQGIKAQVWPQKKKNPAFRQD